MRIRIDTMAFAISILCVRIWMLTCCVQYLEFYRASGWQSGASEFVLFAASYLLGAYATTLCTGGALRNEQWQMDAMHRPRTEFVRIRSPML